MVAPGIHGADGSALPSESPEPTFKKVDEVKTSASSLDNKCLSEEEILLAFPDGRAGSPVPSKLRYHNGSAISSSLRVLSMIGLPALAIYLQHYWHTSHSAIAATTIFSCASQHILAFMEQSKSQEVCTYDALIAFGTALTAQSIFEVLLITIALFFMFSTVKRSLFASTPVYLIDFTTLKADPKFAVTTEKFKAAMGSSGFFEPHHLEFMYKVLSKSCIGEDAAFPEGLINQKPMQLTMDRAREESLYVFKETLDPLFERNRIRPKDVDILIVNCSLFCPTPSLASMIVQMYGMRSDIITFNLGGMGCSAGLLSLDLAKDLLKLHKNKICVVVSFENITQNLYRGTSKSMLITNTLFRMGGAAVLLSNRAGDRRRAKLQLMELVRVHQGADKKSYDAVYQDEDEQGHRGVRLDPEIVKVAGGAISKNLTRLGPKVLPFSEQLKYAYRNIFLRKILKQGRDKPAYVPDFKTAFNHFCIHAGGRGVLDGLEQSLNLRPQDVRPSRAVLRRFGNTSSSSIWYEMEYILGMSKVKNGDKILQLAFGSGFKCNTAVWKSLVSSRK